VGLRISQLYSAAAVFAWDVFLTWRHGSRTASISADLAVLCWLSGTEVEELRSWHTGKLGGHEQEIHAEMESLWE